MNAEAQLASMYLAGRGVPQDFYQAAVWYYLAAVQGHREAQFQLGLLYNKGQGVVRDYVLSYLWLNLSAAHAFGEDRDYKMRVRDAVAQKMLPAELAHAQEMSVVFYKTH